MASDVAAPTDLHHDVTWLRCTAFLRFIRGSSSAAGWDLEGVGRAIPNWGSKMCSKYHRKQRRDSTKPRRLSRSSILLRRRKPSQPSSWCHGENWFLISSCKLLLAGMAQPASSLASLPAMGTVNNRTV